MTMRQWNRIGDKANSIFNLTEELEDMIYEYSFDSEEREKVVKCLKLMFKLNKTRRDINLQQDKN